MITMLLENPEDGERVPLRVILKNLELLLGESMEPMLSQNIIMIMKKLKIIGLE